MPRRVCSLPFKDHQQGKCAFISLVSIWSYNGRKNRITIFLNGQFIIVYSCKPPINHKYSLVIIAPRIFSSQMLYVGWWERYSDSIFTTITALRPYGNQALRCTKYLYIHIVIYHKMQFGNCVPDLAGLVSNRWLVSKISTIRRVYIYLSVSFQCMMFSQK
jgi:hypothetical protein